MAENQTPGSSVGTLVLVFLVIGGAFAWVLVQRELGQGDETPQAVGTSGERRPQGPMPGVDADTLGGPDKVRPTITADITQPGDVAGAPAGARVSLTNVVVDLADGGTFWIRAGDATVQVVSPGGTPTVRAGQQVNVSGTIEAAGSTKQIRASRIDVR